MGITEYFYHGTTKKAVIAFGSLFNDMFIARFNADGTEKERVRVPLSYASKQKFITRLEQNPDLLNDIEVYAPRISFEFDTITYDSTRKNDSMTRTYGINSGNYHYRFGRVPYTLSFKLHFFGKNTDDCLQIFEQIVPWFTPDYSITIKNLDPTDTSHDMTIILDSVQYEDNYEGTFDDRKLVTMTLDFTVKTFYYGPVKKLENKYVSGVTGGTLVPEGMIGKALIGVFAYQSDEEFVRLETIQAGITAGFDFANINNDVAESVYITFTNRIFD